MPQPEAICSVWRSCLLYCPRQYCPILCYKNNVMNRPIATHHAQTRHNQRSKERKSKLIQLWQNYLIYIYSTMNKKKIVNRNIGIICWCLCSLVHGHGQTCTIQLSSSTSIVIHAWNSFVPIGWQSMVYSTPSHHFAIGFATLSGKSVGNASNRKSSLLARSLPT